MGDAKRGQRQSIRIVKVIFAIFGAITASASCTIPVQRSLSTRLRTFDLDWIMIDEEIRGFVKDSFEKRDTRDIIEVFAGQKRKVADRMV